MRAYEGEGLVILCAMNREPEPRLLPRGGTTRTKSRWTLRRLVNLILRVVRLCTAFRSHQLSTTRVIQPTPGTRSRTMSKGQSSRRQPSLLELTQPDSWDQLNRDIQQRMQYTHPHHLPSVRDTASRVNSKERPQDNSEQSLLSEAVKDTLSSPSWTRTHEQVEQAIQELQACNDFRDYPVPLQRNLCKVGWYLCLQQGRVIFREQYPATCFYFLLSGSVLMSSEQGQSHTLTAGASFGDQAIIEDSNRTVTSYTEDQVELFVISKSDFLDLSLRQARLSYQKTKHFAFCKSVSVLKHWPMHLLEAHPDKCKVVQFKSNTVVVKDSTKNPWVYIIMTGSCRVVKRFVYSNGEHTFARNRKKSVPNQTDSPTNKLGLTSDGRQSAATGTMMQRSSPRRKNKHPLSQGAAQDLLQRKGKGRPKPRLPHTISTPVISKRQLHIQPPPKRQFLVQLQLLQPKDTFGLSSFVHPDEPSVTLVSNGAEVVMVSKDFLLQHFSETLKSKLKRQITQFPSQEAMHKRIREHYSWNVYKQSTISQSKRSTIHN